MARSLRLTYALKEALEKSGVAKKNQLFDHICKINKRTDRNKRVLFLDIFTQNYLGKNGDKVIFYDILKGHNIICLRQKSHSRPVRTRTTFFKGILRK